MLRCARNEAKRERNDARGLEKKKNGMHEERGK